VRDWFSGHPNVSVSLSDSGLVVRGASSDTLRRVMEILPEEGTSVDEYDQTLEELFFDLSAS
jgi:hypothetical protein